MRHPYKQGRELHIQHFHKYVLSFELGQEDMLMFPERLPLVLRSFTCLRAKTFYNQRLQDVFYFLQYFRLTKFKLIFFQYAANVRLPIR